MALPDYLGGGKTTPTQSMPGQLEAIAQQLQAGFGQAPGGGDYLSWLKNLYGAQTAAPAPASPTPAAAAKPGVKPFQDMSVQERYAQMGHGTMAGNQWVPPQVAPWMQDRSKVASGMGTNLRAMFNPGGSR